MNNEFGVDWCKKAVEGKAPQAGASARGALGGKMFVRGEKCGEYKFSGRKSERFLGKEVFFRGRGKPRRRGQTRQACLVDRCFGRGVYARVRRMKTEALKGQIWQEPYLVAYWFWRGQDCFSDYLGNYFSDYA